MLPKFDRKDARFFVGNPNISLISGKLSFVSGDSKPEGLKFLALLSIPEYMELREVLDKFKFDIPKIKTMRVLKTEFSKHYGLALEFIQPQAAKEFYDMYHNKDFNSIEESPIVLRWISGVCLDLLVPKESTSPDHLSKTQKTDTPEKGLQKNSDDPTELKAERKTSRRVDPDSGDFDQPTMDVVSVERPSEYIFSISENYQDSEEPHMMEAGGHEEHDVISARDCPICLEPLLSNSCIMVLCSHKFHVHCLQGVQDHTCPVCRYQQYPFQVTFCDQCSQHEGLWCCVICGFVGCGGALPVQGHSKDHAQETSHIYAKPLLNEVNSRVRGIWDHSKEGFIHNLVYRSQEGGQVVIIEQESSQTRSKESTHHSSQNGDDFGEGFKGKSGGKKFSEVQDQINQLISEQLSSAKELFEAELKRIEEEHLMVEAEHRDLKKIFEKEILDMVNDKKLLEAQLAGLKDDNHGLEQRLGQLEVAQTEILAANNLLRKQKKVVESQIEERREAKRAQLASIKQQVSAKIEEIKDIKVHLESQKRFEGKVQPGSSMLILGTSSAGSKNSSGSQKKR